MQEETIWNGQIMIFFIVDKRNKVIDDVVDDVSGELFYESDKLIGAIIWDENEWDFRKKFPLGINIIKDGKEL